MWFRQTFTEYLLCEKLELESSLCVIRRANNDTQLHTLFLRGLVLGWRGDGGRGGGKVGERGPLVTGLRFPLLEVTGASNLAKARWAFLFYDGGLGVTLFTQVRMPRGLLPSFSSGFSVRLPTALCRHSFQTLLVHSLKRKFWQMQ